MMKVLLGGTFSFLHKAHKEMIERGSRIGDLYIGLTGNNFERIKNYQVPPYDIRKKKLENYLQERGIEAKISQLNDQYGSTLEREFDAMVISNETFDFAAKINFIRKSRGIRPLVLENIGTVLGDDYLPIKSERISKGVINENGERLTPIRLGIASKNPEKIKGLENFAIKWFKNYEIHKFEGGGKTEQPFGNEILSGAIERLKSVPQDFDFAFGIEAGVTSVKGHYSDVHTTAIRDISGYVTYGFSSGLPLDGNLIQLLKNGLNLEEATDFLVSAQKSGESKGAIYHFSQGKMERWEVVYESIFSAFVERLASTIPRKS